jgi:hypothetical protein
MHREYACRESTVSAPCDGAKCHSYGCQQHHQRAIDIRNSQVSLISCSAVLDRKFVRSWQLVAATPC